MSDDHEEKMNAAIEATIKNLGSTPNVASVLVILIDDGGMLHWGANGSSMELVGALEVAKADLIDALDEDEDAEPDTHVQ